MRIKYVYNLLILFTIFMLSSCNYVHEWPEVSTKVPFYIHLTYNTEMTIWEHMYDETSVLEIGEGETIKKEKEKGYIRYIIRAYPITKKSQTTEHTAEFVFIRNLEEGYDFETLIELTQGNYNIMVWSDFLENENDASYYNTDQFYQITLQGGEEHPACTDYRDAFSGTTMVALSGDIYEKEPASFEIEMKRPIAKFEFISDDVEEFIEKETIKIQQNINTNVTTSNVCLDDYIVTIYYVGYMPNTYSLFTDKPTNSQTGIMFSSTVTQINNKEASLGFDYVFVKDNVSSITVQVSISNKNGEKLSTSLPINIPLKRDYHTIIRGKFLTSNASGGVSINPDYDGEHNLILP